MSLEAILIIECFKKGNKLLIIGNGGSAAMSQHLAAEFICKFEHDREPLPAIALTTDTSNITAIGNDFGFKWIFARQVKALGKPNDVLLIFTTAKQLWVAKGEASVHSENIIRAATEAERKGMPVIFAPRTGNSTAEIQENQLHWLHEIAREVERAFLPA